jgi:hypothetical protein
VIDLGSEPTPCASLAQMHGDPSPMAAPAPKANQNIRNGLPSALRLFAQHQPDGIRATPAAAASHMQPPAAQGSHRAGERDCSVIRGNGGRHGHEQKANSGRESSRSVVGQFDMFLDRFGYMREGLRCYAGLCQHPTQMP